MSGITPTGELTVCMAHSGWAALKSHCQARWWAGTTWSTCGHPAGMWQGTSWGRQGKGQLRGSASSLTCGCTQQWDRRSNRDARWVCGPLAPVQTGCPHMRYWPLLSRRGWPCWSGCWRAGAYWWQPPPTQRPLLMYRLHVAQPCSTPSTLLFRPTWLHGSLDPLVSVPFSSHILRLPQETSIRPSSEESIHEGEQMLTWAFFSSAGLSPKQPRRKSLLQIHQVPNSTSEEKKVLQFLSLDEFPYSLLPIGHWRIMGWSINLS